MKNKYCVYKHTSPSGKVYIGITGQTASERWRNGLGYRNNSRFFNAILKYGWGNFEHEILFDSLTKGEAAAIEIELIGAFNSTDKRFGYNLTTGGGGCPGAAKSEDYKKSQSEKMKAIWANPEYREHMSTVHKGKKQSQETIEKRRVYLLGHPVSEKTRELISKKTIGRQRRKRPVLCIELGRKFDTIKEAAAWAGIAPPNINRVLHGHGKTSGGYHWEYISKE